MATVRQVGGYVAVYIQPGATIRSVGGYAAVSLTGRFIMEKVAKLALLDLVNEISNHQHLETELAFGYPSPDTSKPGKNTSITLTALPLSDYSGSKQLFYRRLHITEVFRGLVLSEPLTPLASVEDAISQINARYGTYLVLNDVAEQGSVVGQTTITLTANEGSFMFVPGTTVTIGS